MCVLCRDTFSRSDILKRHFQKCSIRRGNPTGASHLSHPQAHVKKNAQAQKAAGLNEGDMNHLNGLNNMPGDGMVPFGMVPVSDGMNNMPGDQNQLSRSSSINRMENGGNQNRRNMPGMGTSQPYGEVPNSMHNQQMPTYSMPPGQNGMPMPQGQNGMPMPPGQNGMPMPPGHNGMPMPPGQNGMPMYPGSNPGQQSGLDPGQQSGLDPGQQSGLDWSQMFQAGAHPSPLQVPLASLS